MPTYNNSWLDTTANFLTDQHLIIKAYLKEIINIEETSNLHLNNLMLDTKWYIDTSEKLQRANSKYLSQWTKLLTPKNKYKWNEYQRTLPDITIQISLIFKCLDSVIDGNKLYCLIKHEQINQLINIHLQPLHRYLENAINIENYLSQLLKDNQKALPSSEKM